MGRNSGAGPKKNAGESPVSKSVGDFYLLLKAIQKLCHDEHTGSLQSLALGVMF